MLLRVAAHEISSDPVKPPASTARARSAHIVTLPITHPARFKSSVGRSTRSLAGFSKLNAVVPPDARDEGGREGGRGEKSAESTYLPPTTL